MLYSQLQDVGLNENEAKIYLAALELGQTTVSRIARKSGIKRTTVYLSLENLKEKGLISMVQTKGRSIFYAEDPRNLERLMEERKERIAKLVPQLLAFTNIIDKNPQIRFFEGKEGIKEVLKDTLNYPDQEIQMLFSESYVNDFGEEFFSEFYRPERIKRKISARVLLPDNEQMRGLVARDERELRRSKLLSPDLFKIKFEMMIYGGGKVNIISYKEKFAMIIESLEINESFKSIFETMWTGAK
ncbi:MAG: helix-turn-helix domain-containing protein [Parcubacteria group bacterium]|jgi:sugar-specific transcriptional regulator TrmB